MAHFHWQLQLLAVTILLFQHITYPLFTKFLFICVIRFTLFMMIYTDVCYLHYKAL